MSAKAAAGDGVRRCEWAGTDPEMVAYHDIEWGVPVHDDTVHFEFLVLEGAQAGLSWSTILKRRAGYRKAFAGFDAAKVARFTPAKVDKLLTDTGIIRNRAKVAAAIGNARTWLAMREAGTDPVDHLWSFVGGRPIQNTWSGVGVIPAETPQSAAMSRDLRARGFRFVGPTICYAFMQSAGMVNDHVVTCFRHAEVAALA